jgi:hypothetical protein
VCHQPAVPVHLAAHTLSGQSRARLIALTKLKQLGRWPHATRVPGDKWSKIKDAGALITTVILAIMVGGWLVAVGMQLRRPVVYDSGGKVTLDTFTRAKDVLTLLLPFLTTAVGFWLGTQGTTQMERQANKAAAEADLAQTTARVAQQTSTEHLVRATELEGQVEFWRYRAATAEERVATLEDRLEEARRDVVGVTEGDFEAVLAPSGIGTSTSSASAQADRVTDPDS